MVYACLGRCERIVEMHLRLKVILHHHGRYVHRRGIWVLLANEHRLGLWGRHARSRSTARGCCLFQFNDTCFVRELSRVWTHQFYTCEGLVRSTYLLLHLLGKLLPEEFAVRACSARKFLKLLLLFNLARHASSVGPLNFVSWKDRRVE